MKYDPKYSLSIEVAPTPVIPGSDDSIGDQPQNIVFELPIRCDFDIRRALLSSAQTATFRLYELGDRNRDLMQKDWFDLSDIRAVQLRVGWADEAPTLIFNGTVKSAQSRRTGASEGVVTTIEAFDGGAAMANSFSLKSIAAVAITSDLIKNLASDLQGVAKSAIIGKFDGITKRGTIFAGNTWQYILQLSDGLACIDGNQLKVLNPNEYCGAQVPVINSDSGLIGTPERFKNMMRVTMLLTPQFTIGQLVSLESTTLRKFNGIYKVVGIAHRGTIALSVAGERRTELTLWSGLGDSDSWKKADEVLIQQGIIL